jgi:hypothetical protein
MGFTSGTGSVGSYHDIRNWVVDEQFNSIAKADNPSQAIPEPGVLLLLSIGLAGMLINQRRHFQAERGLLANGKKSHSKHAWRPQPDKASGLRCRAPG